MVVSIPGARRVPGGRRRGCRGGEIAATGRRPCPHSRSDAGSRRAASSRGRPKGPAGRGRATRAPRRRTSGIRARARWPRRPCPWASPGGPTRRFPRRPSPARELHWPRPRDRARPPSPFPCPCVKSSGMKRRGQHAGAHGRRQPGVRRGRDPVTHRSRPIVARARPGLGRRERRGRETPPAPSDPVAALRPCAQPTSNRPAAPMPPPMHMVTTTFFAPRRLPSISACPARRAPDMP